MHELQPAAGGPQDATSPMARRLRMLTEPVDITHTIPRRAPLLFDSSSRALTGGGGTTNAGDKDECTVAAARAGRGARFAVVSAAGLSPAQIVFEVTESERVPSNPGHLIGILDYFRAARFRVALDDVGSGYSSLVMLGNVRPDFLKLDKGLTTGVIDRPRFARSLRRSSSRPHSGQAWPSWPRASNGRGRAVVREPRCAVPAGLPLCSPDRGSSARADGDPSLR